MQFFIPSNVVNNTCEEADNNLDIDSVKQVSVSNELLHLAK